MIRLEIHVLVHVCRLLHLVMCKVDLAELLDLVAGGASLVKDTSIVVGYVNHLILGPSAVHGALKLLLVALLVELVSVDPLAVKEADKLAGVATSLDLRVQALNCNGLEFAE